MKIAISSGHGAKISGAVGPSPWGLNEHAEAVKVVNQVAEYLRSSGVQVETFEDKISTSQNTNLQTIVNWHNNIAFAGGAHDLDLSIHFNSNGTTETQPRGTETHYYSQQQLAADMSTDVSDASGLIDRGPVHSTGLYFLAHTREKSLLEEVCFVNSKPDADLYRQHFNAICGAIAATIAPTSVTPEPPSDALLDVTGKCSWFGGPSDDGVSADEGLAFIHHETDAPHLFLSTQPANTTGLARRLDAERVFYVACRWDYQRTPKTMLADANIKALVKAKGKEFFAWPADWGPNEATGRVADLSPALLEALSLTTDDQVQVVYPAP